MVTAGGAGGYNRAVRRGAGLLGLSEISVRKKEVDEQARESCMVNSGLVIRIE